MTEFGTGLPKFGVAASRQLSGGTAAVALTQSGRQQGGPGADYDDRSAGQVVAFLCARDGIEFALTIRR